MKKMNIKTVITEGLLRHPNSMLGVVEALDIENGELLKKIKALGSIKENSRNQIHIKEYAEVINNKLISDGSHEFHDDYDYLKILRNIVEKFDIKDPKEIKKISVSDFGEEENLERKISYHFFSKAWTKMSAKEKETLLTKMNLDTAVTEQITPVILFSLSLGGGIVARLLALEIAMIVSVFISRLLAIELAATTVLGRIAGGVLGPVGWVASGAWLAYELAGPSYKRVVPAVLHLSYIRQLLLSSVTIGVVGDTSVGKDAVISAIFNLETSVNPMAGSTTNIEIYDIKNDGSLRVFNFPGFFDPNSKKIDETTNYYINHVDLLCVIIDVSRGFSASDKEAIRKVQKTNKKYLVVLNKIDLLRENQKETVIANFQKILKSEFSYNDEIFSVAADPLIKEFKENGLDGFKKAIKLVLKSNLPYTDIDTLFS